MSFCTSQKYHHPILSDLKSYPSKHLARLKKKKKKYPSPIYEFIECSKTKTSMVLDGPLCTRNCSQIQIQHGHQHYLRRRKPQANDSSHQLVFRVECERLPVNQLLHLFLSQRVLFKVKVKRSRANRLVADVVERVQVWMGQCTFN